MQTIDKKQLKNDEKPLKYNKNLKLIKFKLI